MLHDPKKDLPTAALVLLNAADYMETHGWCQGMYSKKGAVCLVGAILYTTDDDERRKQAWDNMRKHLGQTPHRWNDDVCKSKEEAVAALRGAAWANK